MNSSCRNRNLPERQSNIETINTVNFYSSGLTRVNDDKEIDKEAKF